MQEADWVSSVTATESVTGKAIEVLTCFAIAVIALRQGAMPQLLDLMKTKISNIPLTIPVELSYYIPLVPIQKLYEQKGEKGLSI